MSLNSVVPNLPSSPCNFKPVNVAAIIQNLGRNEQNHPNLVNDQHNHQQQ